MFVLASADGSVIATLERRLKQMEKVLRFITLRLDDKLKKSNKLTKRWAKIDRIRKKSMDSRSEEKESEAFSESEEDSDATEK